MPLYVARIAHVQVPTHSNLELNQIKTSTSSFPLQVDTIGDACMIVSVLLKKNGLEHAMQSQKSNPIPLCYQSQIPLWCIYHIAIPIPSEHWPHSFLHKLKQSVTRTWLCLVCRKRMDRTEHASSIIRFRTQYHLVEIPCDALITYQYQLHFNL